MNNYLTMHIKVNLNGNYSITGNLNAQGQYEILENFIRMNLGAGRDDSTPNTQEEYHITLQWFPENDEIRCKHDTGNKGLRDGLLQAVFRQLEED